LNTGLLSYYPLLIPLAPIIAAALAALPRRDVMSNGNYRLGWWALIGGFIVSIPMLWQVTHSADPIRVARCSP